MPGCLDARLIVRSMAFFVFWLTVRHFWAFGTICRHMSYLNSIGVCVLSIALLWLTTLQMATKMASFFVNIPSFAAVSSECMNAFQNIEEEKSNYEQCVSIGLQRCDESLRMDVLSENKQQQRLISDNLEALSNVKKISEICLSHLTPTKYFLQAWERASTRNTVIYNLYSFIDINENHNTRNISEIEKREVTKNNLKLNIAIKRIRLIIGGRSSQNHDLAYTITSYTSSTMNRVKHLSSYRYIYSCEHCTVSCSSDYCNTNLTNLLLSTSIIYSLVKI